MTFVVISLIIGILSIISFKNIFNRFGLLKSSRREFYECGFKPIIQKPIQFSIQFVFICLFFILYDIELAFSFPLVSLYSNSSFIDFFFFFFIYITILVSLGFDYDKSLTDWRF